MCKELMNLPKTPEKGGEPWRAFASYEAELVERDGDGWRVWRTGDAGQPVAATVYGRDAQGLAQAIVDVTTGNPAQDIILAQRIAAMLGGKVPTILIIGDALSIESVITDNSDVPVRVIVKDTCTDYADDLDAPKLDPDGVECFLSDYGTPDHGPDGVAAHVALLEDTDA